MRELRQKIALVTDHLRLTALGGQATPVAAAAPAALEGEAAPVARHDQSDTPALSGLTGIDAGHQRLCDAGITQA